MYMYSHKNSETDFFGIWKKMSNGLLGRRPVYKSIYQRKAEKAHLWKVPNTVVTQTEQWQQWPTDFLTACW